MVNDQKLIAYCGLYCGNCFGYTRTVSEAAKNLRRTLWKEKMKNVWSAIPFLGEYAPFKKSLDALASLRCKSCRENGGPPWCKIRICCRKKSYEGCWECAVFETYKKLDFLRAGHKDKYAQNLRKIKKLGPTKVPEKSMEW